MKKSKKILFDLIIFFIGYSVANFVVSHLGLKFRKIISFEFVLNVLIATICFTAIQFIINKVISLLRKNKG